jgi:hypothetical protein
MFDEDVVDGADQSDSGQGERSEREIILSDSVDGGEVGREMVARGHESAEDEIVGEVDAVAHASDDGDGARGEEPAAERAFERADVEDDDKERHGHVQVTRAGEENPEPDGKAGEVPEDGVADAAPLGDVEIAE